ncbi:MAG: YicC family protein [Woeseia sp.]|nr:YicC family protein [Woeseia sp.]MBT8096611.1 YicC family protein [Woeseia sp.]NNE60708.1 YicC family protein [Woeseia sp.]NNL54710.1 YicC family protein [Woeseia sp.]
MLHSMTGFARQVAEFDSGTLTCEIRSVNHRYLDVQFRLPDELRPKEADFRTRVSGTVKRGKIDCTLHFRRATSDTAGLPLNRELVARLVEGAAAVAAMLPKARKLDPLDVLRWPGVIDETPVDVEPLYAAGKALMDDTLQGLNAMRRSEGERIAEMLNQRLVDVTAIAGRVRERMPEVLSHVRQRQLERISKLDVAADPARLETELALISQKLDVDEELDRLESHVSEIRQNLDADQPVGRRLDFLMQELNREANTLGSKSADTLTTQAAVDLKVLIEQMREQIQNVE